MKTPLVVRDLWRVNEVEEGMDEEDIEMEELEEEAVRWTMEGGGSKSLAGGGGEAERGELPMGEGASPALGEGVGECLGDPLF